MSRFDDRIIGYSITEKLTELSTLIDYTRGLTLYVDDIDEIDRLELFVTMLKQLIANIDMRLVVPDDFSTLKSTLKI